MSKHKGKGDGKKDVLDISKDDFESPVVFKKFKPSSNNYPTDLTKHKKSSRKKQLTLHQVYNKNFEYSDMNSEHLQLALALSRSTSEILGDNSLHEEFPLTSQKEGKKKTLLEFGFKIDKPKLKVDNKMIKKEHQKINKKSKFRFVTPILLMRTEEDRESLIQSKLSSIFGQNSIYPAYNENSIVEVSSEELEKIRCRRCSLFNLNGNDDLFEEKGFMVPQINIGATRGRVGILLKDWKQIALRDRSPSPLKIEITSVGEVTDFLGSKIEKSTISLEDSIPGNNLQKYQLSNHAHSINYRNNLSRQNLQSEVNLENNKSPCNIGLSVSYECGAISPDLFDNDLPLSKMSPQIKKNLYTLFNQEQKHYENHTENSIDSNILQSSGKHFSDKKCKVYVEKKTYHKETDNIHKDVDSSRNECGERNHDGLGEKIIVKTEQNKSNISSKSKCKKDNTDKSILLKQRSEYLSKSNTSSLVSNEDTIILTSDEDDFSSTEIKCTERMLKANIHQEISNLISTNGYSNFNRKSFENTFKVRSSNAKDFQISKSNSYENCVDSHSNKDMINILTASAEDYTSLKSIEYGFSEDYELSERISTNGENLDEIILSSDDEHSKLEKNDNMSDMLELEKLYDKYNNLNNHSVDISYHKYSNINESNFIENQILSKKRLSDSFNYLSFTDINNFNEAAESKERHEISNNSFENNKIINDIILVSNDEISNAGIAVKKSEQSPDILKHPQSKEEFSDNLNIPTINHSSDISWTTKSTVSDIHKCYKKNSDTSSELEFEDKYFLNDYKTDFSSKYSAENCEDITGTREPLFGVTKLLHEGFSDILSDTVLVDVFEKNSSFIKMNCYDTKEVNSKADIESKGCHISSQSEDKIKYIWNESMNKSNQQNHIDVSTSFSCKSSLGDEDSNQTTEINTDKQLSSEFIQKENFNINLRNIRNISKLNLDNTPDHKVRKTSNTPLRRCTSFSDNGTPTNSISFTRHKSESNVTPNKKFIIKTKNITPMLNYNNLSTPDIIKELDKFGLKPLKRKRGINLLKHIYETTHPILESHETNVGEIPAVKRKKSHMNEDLEVIESQMKIKEFTTMNLCSGTILESEAIFERQRSSKIYTCQVPLQIVWHNFLSENPNILNNILLYEPLQVEVVHKMLKDLGYKFHIQDLITFLDQKCITIRISQGHQGKMG